MIANCSAVIKNIFEKNAHTTCRRYGLFFGTGCSCRYEVCRQNVCVKRIVIICQYGEIRFEKITGYELLMSYLFAGKQTMSLSYNGAEPTDPSENRLLFTPIRQLRKAFQNAALNSLRETNLITKSLGKAGT